MKKSIFAVFSVSLTAGTIYLTYSQIKAHMTRKLVEGWQVKAALNSEQVKFLQEELDKLYIWELKSLSRFSKKKLSGAPENEWLPLLAQLNEKKITEKADFKLVEDFLFK